MVEPELWPLRSVLPLVHRERRDEWGLPVQGFLVVGYGSTVFLANIYDLEGSAPLAAKLSALEQMTYVSFEAIVADGWEVD
jgi:hypothetical protein